MDPLIQRRLVPPPFFFLFLLLLGSFNSLSAQINSIQSFRAIKDSPAVLQVTVDYFFNGMGDTSMAYIYATVLDSNGNTMPQFVNGSQIPLHSGKHSVTLNLIKKKQTFTNDFNSAMVHVCMSTNRSAILCQSFPYTKKWSLSSNASISTTTANDSCEITIYIAGELKHEIKSKDMPMFNGIYTVKYFTVQSSGKIVKNVPIVRGVREYTLMVAAGKPYKIYIPQFRTEPKLLEGENCNTNMRFGKSLMIKGPILE